MTRTQKSPRKEVSRPVWAEVDLDAAIWVVPAKRMKADKDHRVPLSNS